MSSSSVEREDRHLQDIDGVNISKYISESVTNLMADKERVKPIDTSRLAIFSVEEPKGVFPVLQCLGLDKSVRPWGNMTAALGKQGALRQTHGVFAALTNGGLPPSYIQSTIDDDINLELFNPREDSPVNLAIAQYDTARGGGRGSLRGFALLQVKNEAGEIIRHSDQSCSPNSATMELLVLGNKAGTIMKKRGTPPQLIPRGGNIIRCTQWLAKNLARGLFLFGLETVLPLYQYFGWRKVPSTLKATNSICPIPDKAVVLRSEKVPSNVGQFYKKYGTEEQVSPAQWQQRQQMAQKHFRKHDVTVAEVEEVYKEELTRILSHAPAKEQTKEMLKGADPGYFTGSREEAKEAAMDRARDQGFAMLLCPDLNPYSERDVGAEVEAKQPMSVELPAKSGQGGTKKRKKYSFMSSHGPDGKRQKGKAGGRKRTKKRALKKRYRRTRYNKKYRKTKKRKRRRRTRKRRR